MASNKISPNKHNLVQDTKLSIDKKLILGDAGEYMVGDGTDLSIISSRHLSLITGNDAGNIYLDTGGGSIIIRDEQDADDNFKITTTKGTGETILQTVSAASPGDGHLVIIADGFVKFQSCGVGFRKYTATFSSSLIVGDGGDSTDIDFRLGNKWDLELTGNMGATDFLNLIFPAVTGNFLLVLAQDGTGSRTVHADSWVAYQSDGSTKATNAAFANGTDGDLRFAGGTAPTLTTTADKVDIISIYWDSENQTAFAVPSLNF